MTATVKPFLVGCLVTALACSTAINGWQAKRLQAYDALPHYGSMANDVNTILAADEQERIASKAASTKAVKR